MAKNFRLKIAGTYKRKVEIDVPGDELEPTKAEIVVELRDVDPDELQSDQETIAAAQQQLKKLFGQMRDDKPDEAQVDEAESALADMSDMTPKIDKILVGVELPEGSEVIDRNGDPLTGQALVDFAKSYPRWKKAILKKHAEENEEGGETAAMGNLLRSGGRGLG